LLSNAAPEAWLGNLGHGWVDEGVAHWFEDKVTGKCTNFCYEEVGIHAGATFKGGRWRVPVRRWVEEGGLVPFATVAALNTDQLRGQHHAQAFAYVDFLLQRYGGKAFVEMVRLLKRRKPTREALRKSTGLNPLTFDDAFATWVKEHYPLQER